MSLIDAALNDRWNSIPLHHPLSTPSDRKSLTVEAVLPDEIHILTAGGTPMKISRGAFYASLAYLLDHGHVASKPCVIDSNQQRDLAGPLCRAARDGNTANGGTRVITYVLPILQAMGLVEIDSGRPNKTWLI